LPDKENAKHFTGTKKCAGVRRGNGFSHDLAERKSSRPNGWRSSYRLLCAVFSVYIPYYINAISTTLPDSKKLLNIPKQPFLLSLSYFKSNISLIK